jgi:D-3-phosphoglycerate dehydrogenase
VLCDGGVESIGLDELFATSDAVSLHCPLTPETRHLVDAARLRSVRPGLVLVNTSRGALVDLAALDEALQSGQVGAAGLDVLEDEPTPDLTRRLFARPNVVLTPHLAWYSIEARRDLAVKAAEEAYRLVTGERPRNLVNPSAREAP